IPESPYWIVPKRWLNDGASGAVATHSGFVCVNLGGTTESGYWTPRTPGATWTRNASPKNTRKIARPTTAVLFERNTFPESLSSSKRALLSVTVAMASHSYRIRGVSTAYGMSMMHVVKPKMREQT